MMAVGAGGLLLLTSLIFTVPLSTRDPLRSFGQSVALSNDGCITCHKPRGRLAPTPGNCGPFCLDRCNHRNSHCVVNGRTCSIPCFSLLGTGRRNGLATGNRRALTGIGLVHRRTGKHSNRLAPLKTLRRRNVAGQVVREFPRVFTNGAGVRTQDAIIVHYVLSVRGNLRRVLHVGPGLRVFRSTDRRSVCCVGRKSECLSDLGGSINEGIIRRRFSGGRTYCDQIVRRLFGSPT